jgi:hypothetical protein
MEIDSTPTALPISDKQSFVSFVIQQPKSDLGNLVQYAFMAMIPVAAIVYASQNMLAPIDSKMGTGQLALEAGLGLGAVLITMYFANRTITYFPTYSGVEYADINLISAMIPFLLMLFIADDDGSGTSIGVRIKELVKRLIEPEEPPAKKPEKRNESQYPPPGMPPGMPPQAQISQPPAQQPGQQTLPSQNFTTMYDTGGSSIEPFNQSGGFSAF